MAKKHLSMKRLILALLLLASVACFGQTPTPIRTVTTLPVTCNGGTTGKSTDVVILVAAGTGSLYVCTAPNTWTLYAVLPAGPTSPNNVPQLFICTPSGGLCTGQYSLAGVQPRSSGCPSNVDTVLVTDRIGYVSWSDAAACAVTLPQANSAGFDHYFGFLGCAIGAGTVTITPTVSTISYSTGSGYTSAANHMDIATGKCAWIFSDNVNYYAILR